MTTAKIEFPQLTAVQTAISKTACDIKKIVLRRIEDIKDQFPQMGFATNPDHWCSSDYLGDHQIYRVVDLLGIPLTSYRAHDCPYIVVLTPKGILKCPFVDAVGGNFGRSYYPHFPRAITNDRLWAQYGEYAMSLLYPRPVALKYSNKKTDLGIAGIGEEFCRWCGRVDLAVKFRFEGCPAKCTNGSSWLAQYGVEVD